MSSNINFVVTVGNYGTIVAFFNRGIASESLFFEALDDSHKEELRALFLKHKSAPVYLLVDTLDQSYRIKLYPGFKRGDLTNAVNRDLQNENTTNDMKSYLVLNEKSRASSTQWECLIISSAHSDNLTNWIDFLLTQPNYFAGTYMLPVEAFALRKALEVDINSKIKVAQKKINLCCFVVQNKVSGIRQIVFSGTSIIFTRILDYKFSDTDFAKKYERDILSTFEYLKRMYPDLILAEFDVINIFARNVLIKIETINHAELNLINYTPAQVALQIGTPMLVTEEEENSDLLISKCFISGKKVLRFATKEVERSKIAFALISIARRLQIALAIGCLAALCGIFYIEVAAKKTINELKDKQSEANTKLEEAKATAAAGEKGLSKLEGGTNIEEIIDIAKIKSLLAPAKRKFVDNYAKMEFAREAGVKLNYFSYATANFDYKSPASISNYLISAKGFIINQGGSPDSLIASSENLISSLNSKFAGDKIEVSKISSSIDYTQKYYSFPLEYSIHK